MSVVIPAYNEAELLPRLLATLSDARHRYKRGAESVEIIVADNGSEDGTPAIAKAAGCTVVEVVERRIATVRNGGAGRAGGDILCFVDADSQVHPETFNAIDEALASGSVAAGATGVHLERWSVGIAATYALLLPFVWALRMDTGVVFCRREDFETVGGYDERRAFSEDVQLLVDLRRLGKPRGQRLVRLRRVKATTSMRKFDEHGDWHFFTDLLHLLPLMLWRPEASTEYAQRYWYGDQRPPDDPSSQR
jgi:glycosyltransferase involved in cell wall biosynthesis